MQINRLFGIIYILINQKTTTARELSEHFEVSQRTVYRDIDTLCQAGIPIYTNRGKGGGICLMENYVLNKSLLSDKEQSEILSALQGLKAVSSLETEQVLTKLNSLFGNKTRGWIEVEFSPWSSTEEDRQMFRQIKDAILDRRVVEFDYYNSSGRESHRTVEPVKLAFRGQAWYLYAYCRERKALRYFKLSRLKKLNLTSETFTEEHTSKTEDEMSMERLNANVKIISIQLKVDVDMAYRVFDEFPSEAVTRNEDGSLLIRTSVPDDPWLISYLMSFEDHLEVLEPSHLRALMVEKHKKALKKYQ